MSLETTADYFNLSYGYLSRLFKEKTGYGFSEYVINEKLQKAKELVVSGNTSIKTVAERLGYYKLSYFSVIFKEKFGMTPTQFRKSLNRKS